MVALFVFSTFILFITADLIVSWVRKPAMAAAVQRIPRAVLSYPTGLFFSKGHTWAQPEGEFNVKVGLGDFIANLVGKIDSVKIHEGEIKAGQPLFTIMQDGKTLTLASPVSGKISEINEALITNPELIKERPLKNQWVVKLETSDPAKELRLLQMASEAKSWILAEAARFVDSYSRIFGKPGYATSLAEGGTLVEGALGLGDEEAWNNFQQDFLKV